jgi:hypothetical protein
MSTVAVLRHIAAMKTRHSAWILALLASIVVLQGCASSASGGATQAPMDGCRGQNPSAHCYGGPP